MNADKISRLARVTCWRAHATPVLQATGCTLGYKLTTSEYYAHVDGVPTATAFVPTAAAHAMQPDDVQIANPYLGRPLAELDGRGGASGGGSTCGDDSGGRVLV